VPGRAGRCRRGPKSNRGVRSDERLRAELELADRFHLPRSIVLGRPWPKPGEPLFLPEDTEDALAYLADLKTRCTGCGHPRDETTALDDRGRPLHDWEPHSTVCQACEALDIEKRRIRDSGDASALDGRIFYSTRVDGDDT